MASNHNNTLEIWVQFDVVAIVRNLGDKFQWAIPQYRCRVRFKGLQIKNV